VPIIGGAFFQAIGKARPALVINLARQILIFIPSVILLPLFFDLLGVWLSWPFTDFFSVIISGIFLIREIKVINKMINVKESQARSVVT
jgi:Na+-driven multidrug efflux pump